LLKREYDSTWREMLGNIINVAITCAWDKVKANLLRPISFSIKDIGIVETTGLLLEYGGNTKATFFLY
jgi:hypothetical protein